MLINLHKTFRFAHDKNNYDVGYVFQKESMESEKDASAISLLITYSKNRAKEVNDKVTRASAIFFQSNEQIQKIIEQKVLSVGEGLS